MPDKKPVARARAADDNQQPADFRPVDMSLAEDPSSAKPSSLQANQVNLATGFQSNAIQRQEIWCVSKDKERIHHDCRHLSIIKGNLIPASHLQMMHKTRQGSLSQFLDASANAPAASHAAENEAIRQQQSVKAPSKRKRSDDAATVTETWTSLFSLQPILCSSEWMTLLLQNRCILASLMFQCR
ncbi:hypothetical protein EDD86DRAFT_399 [Gorgonomyces haynaldii]|nr:hypothetical protein EDD86DRAFT_399 [Gorgonomyces haynaldii]